MQKFADAPLTLHEKCGGPVRRLLSVPALQFKGSGFYINELCQGRELFRRQRRRRQRRSQSGDGGQQQGSFGRETESTPTSTKSSNKPAPT